MTTTVRLTVYGAEWCKDCRRTSALLAHFGVDYVHVDLEAEPDRADEARQLAGIQRIPVVHFDDGDVLVEPSDADLTAALQARGLVDGTPQ
ncbi:MAG: glutaredoxin domain-containing protein [Actinomycetota bacterium]|nr:glutaredoxin domain-containing protein [Actinomycetota bacterium]MDA3007882.1 glutaredoxin domain-containing protein [Actinomycetota bacterium]MDA3035159.1 glutaredoxin domain-containing protein [Actinomycetota bacterium]